MAVSSQEVHLSENQTHYILKIHPSQRERARSIAGWYFETEGKYWRYPKTARSYDALVAEFGDDVVGGVTVNRPGSAPSVAPAVDSTVTQQLHQEIERIHQSLTTLSDSKASELEIAQTTLSLKEAELAELRQQCYQLSLQLQQSQQQSELYSNQITELQQLTQSLQVELSGLTKKGTKTELQKFLKDDAKQASGNHPQFCAMIDQMKLGSSFPIELVKAMETELRHWVKADERASIHDLLTQAGNSGLLSVHALDAAHMIRKQRNLMAHSSVDKKTMSARVLLCLFAAALLWSELPH